jgi:Flp pilus assembly protein TadG
MNSKHKNLRSFQQGVTAVEFALVALFIFFPLLIGIIEFGRAMFIWNTVQEITRHAARDATVTDFTSTSAMNLVRQNAIFRTSAGPLPAGPEITDTKVAIKYLNLALGTVDPSTTCPVKNINVCLNNPADASCIRFVQASVCQPGTGEANENTCAPVKFVPMVSMFSTILNIDIPSSPVVMPAESLGYRPSATAC